MPVPEAARAHYVRQQNLTAAAIVGARSSWRRLNPNTLDRSWGTVGPRLTVLVAGIQRSAALDGARYVPEVLEELDIVIPPAGRVNVAPLVGVASDGRDLPSLLREPLITTKARIGAGAAVDEALAAGLQALEMIVATQIADAARAAAGVSITARPRVGYTRMLNPPSCSRCAVLAGKWFRYNQGFARHPRCDCRHIPTTEAVAGDLTVDTRAVIEAGQVTGLSKADTRAILDGADPGQVINASRKGAGMTTAAGKATTSGTTRRAFAGRRMAQQGDTFQGTRTSRYRRASTARLRPEAIYQQAASREEAIELLHRYGYLL